MQCSPPFASLRRLNRSRILRRKPLTIKAGKGQTRVSPRPRCSAKIVARGCPTAKLGGEPAAASLILLASFSLCPNYNSGRDWRQSRWTTRESIQFEVVRIIEAYHRAHFRQRRSGIQNHVPLNIEVLHLRRIEMGSSQNRKHNVV